MEQSEQTDPQTQVHPRVIVVIGCTGSGKTKLGIALSRALNAEIISCDSIQLYQQLPIAGNQCTLEEAQGVRQHCMSVVPPYRSMHVHDFRRTANALIADITRRGKNVVIVAGTFYWLESILFHSFLNRPDESMTDVADEEQKVQTESSHVHEMHDADGGVLQIPIDSPFSLASLQSISREQLSTISLPDLAALTAILLTQPSKSTLSSHSCLSSANSLLHHLSSVTPTQFREVLRTMNKSNVTRIAFVRNILTPSLLSEQSSTNITPSASTSSPSSSTFTEPSAAVTFPSTHLFELLDVIDPASAVKLHPNNYRKISRSLEVFVENNGRPQSELIAATGGSKGNAGLCFPVQTFWLDSQTPVLENRLDLRIDDMMRRGLLQEVEALYESLWRRQYTSVQGDVPSSSDWQYTNPLDTDCSICASAGSRDILPILPTPSSALNAKSTILSSANAPCPCTKCESIPPQLGQNQLQFDYERGVGQALGFKEFQPYFKLRFHTPLCKCSSDDQQDQPLKKQKTHDTADSSSTAESSSARMHRCTCTTPAMLKQCIDACLSSLKSHTRSYARVQARWIKSRLLTTPGHSNSGKETQDSTDLSILRLDASNTQADVWESNVTSPAVEVASKFLRSESFDLLSYAKFSSALPPLSNLPNASTVATSSTSSWSKFTCDVCQQVCNGQLEWEKHTASRKHRARLVGGSKKEEQLKQQEQKQKERALKRQLAQSNAGNESGANSNGVQ